ncbi:uncharacterized protein LOC110019834 [Phalaenopsis equestris]|uniref:uncharacterized protein LOC110019834 n=1 Tax=Phalaenopsis equestris TaxID=78828 RepID=UPI0009E45468|nr:uncharacterized protein LOC110019834 [Phalaenopsis equestris]
MSVMLTATASGILQPLNTFPPVVPSHLIPSPSPRQLGADSSSYPATQSASERFLGYKAVSVPQREFRKPLEGKPSVFFLDVNPICYRGVQPSLHSFANWLSLFFSQVSLRNPVIAVLDGEGGNEYRRQLLPSYKAHRRKFIRHWDELQRLSSASVRSGELQITNVLHKCNVPVIKVNGFEADDVIATLADQVLQRGHRVVIGSPDKDFKQLICEDVHMVMPMPELRRWSFYTLKHYIEQYKCDPSSDLSLRCIIGDEIDGVPGIQHVAPGFGRKTALKLLRKHGSLSNLLGAAAVRTVGRQYVQNALTKHSDYLWRNFEVLSLRRNAEVHLKEEWLLERDVCNDSTVLSSFIEVIDNSKRLQDSLRYLRRQEQEFVSND